MPATPATRWAAGALAAACLSVLVIAACLIPSAEGVGTHRQLGLPPCSWQMAFGVPCPTCGMTTAFSLVAHRDFTGAVATQPFGAILAVVVAATFWLSLHGALFGSRMGILVSRIAKPWPLWGMLVLAAAAWVWKLAQMR